MKFIYYFAGKCNFNDLLPVEGNIEWHSDTMMVIEYEQMILESHETTIVGTKE